MVFRGQEGGAYHLFDAQHVSHTMWWFFSPSGTCSSDVMNENTGKEKLMTVPGRP